MNKKTYRLLLVALFMLVSAAMGAVSVNAASGFMSPMDGDEVLFGEPVEIQYVTGYASNRQTYCEFQVNDPDGNIVFKESYSYKNMYDVVDASFIPAAAGAYTIKAQIYYYIEFYQLVNGIQRTTKTRQNQVTSTITVNAVKEYSPTAAASDVRILQSKETTENSITISWNPCSVPDVQIIYSEDQNNMPVFPTDSWVTPSNKEQPEFTINNLKADTDYYIQMRTVKMMYPFFVYGKPSAVLKAKTLPEAVSPAPTETVPDGTYTAGQFKYTVKNNKATVKAPVNKNATKLTIPATVKINSIKVKVIGIGNGAMSGMKKLTSLTIGSNVEKIGKKAAYNCPKLKTLTVKTKKLKAEKVGANAFGKSKKMTVKCPAGMKNVYKKILVKKGVRKDCTFK